jgi:uridine kinase
MVRPVVVSIAGPAGAGKSQLAKAVVERIGPAQSARVPTDYFLQSMDDRTGHHRETLNYDWELLAERLALAIGTGTSTPDYDFARLQRRDVCGGLPFVIRRTMLTDAMEPFSGAHIKIMLAAPATVRRQRIIERDRVWSTRVQDRWTALESMWERVQERQLVWDLVLDGTTALERNVVVISEEIERWHRFGKDGRLSTGQQ